jgi:hypothetical protein
MKNAAAARPREYFYGPINRRGGSFNRPRRPFDFSISELGGGGNKNGAWIIGLGLMGLLPILVNNFNLKIFLVINGGLASLLILVLWAHNSIQWAATSGAGPILARANKFLFLKKVIEFEIIKIDMCLDLAPIYIFSLGINLLFYICIFI